MYYFGYARVSDKSQVEEGNGLDNQENWVVEDGQNAGETLVQMYKEPGISGRRNDRPEFQKMLKAIFNWTKINKEPVTIRAYSQSRLYRDIAEFLKLSKQFELLNIQTKFKFADMSGLKGAVKFLVTGQQALVDEYFSIENSQNTIQKQTDTLKSGRWYLHPLKGYVRGYEEVFNIGIKTIYKNPYPVPDLTVGNSGLTVYEIVQAGIKKLCNSTIANQGQLLRFFKVQGLACSSSAISRMMANLEFYAGIIKYEPWSVYVDNPEIVKHQPMITREELIIYQTKSSKAKSNFTIIKGATPDFTLRGKVVCDLCLKKLVGSNTINRHGTRYPYYLCQNKICKVYGKSVKAEIIHNHFIDCLKGLQLSHFTELFITYTDLYQEEQTTVLNCQINNLKSKILNLNRKIEKVTDSYISETNEMIKNRIKIILEKENGEIETLENNLKSLQNQKKTVVPRTRLLEFAELTKNLDKMWLNSSLEGKAILYNMLFDGDFYFSLNSIPRTPRFSLFYQALSAISTTKNISGGTGGLHIELIMSSIQNFFEFTFTANSIKVT